MGQCDLIQGSVQVIGEGNNMSKSFQLVNGDLVVGAGRAFQQVTGKQKLFQDLRLWILERIGTDPATPTYGSRLDGGVIDGAEVASFIGEVANQERLDEIEYEIATLLALYQQEQVDKMRRETIQFGGQHTLLPDEILHRVEAIRTSLLGTTVLVRVHCSTLTGDTFKLTIPAQV